MQYTKEEYQKLVPTIIHYMQSTGEWGEFFPASISPFGYNETLASDFFPLDEKQVTERRWKWHRDENASKQYLGPTIKIPKKIEDVSDAICAQILSCEVTGKPYKITPQELTFYRRMKIPVPRICPEERHRQRMERRNPRKLWERTCAKCGKGIETSYSLERPEIVYCDKCYLETVY